MVKKPVPKHTYGVTIQGGYRPCCGEDARKGGYPERELKKQWEEPESLDGRTGVGGGRGGGGMFCIDALLRCHTDAACSFGSSMFHVPQFTPQGALKCQVLVCISDARVHCSNKKGCKGDTVSSQMPWKYSVLFG